MKTNQHQKLQHEVADLIDRHKARIIMICRAYTRSREDLDDCFQDVATRIWEGYANFRGEAAEATWVYRVTLNCAINFSRRSARQPSTVSLLDHDIIEENPESTRATQKLYTLINRLNPLEKALVLLWLENLPYSEIALIMGISVKNVSVKLTRIKEKLKTYANTTKL